MTMQSQEYDVVMVGARVAGAATALHLAGAGHRVAVVDRNGPPVDTTSTHALMRTGVLQLCRMGLLDQVIAAGTPAVRQVKLVFGEKTVQFPVAVEFGVDAYYAPRRTVLDTIILEAAVAAGAEFHSGVTVHDVSRDDTGRVNGVFARTGHGGDRWIRARHVVGADGVRSRIARSVGAEVLRSSTPTNAVVYGYFEGIAASGYDFRFVDQRNVGCIPTNDGLTLVFVGGPRHLAPRDGEHYLTETLRRVAPDLGEAVDAGRRVGRLHRSNGIPGMLRAPGGPGWSLVGDAGFSEDPISAHGITDALRDAEICAAAVDTILRDPELEHEAQDHYHGNRDRFAVPLLETTTRLAGFEWDGPEASLLMRHFGDISDEECAYLHRRRTGAVVG